MDPNKINSDVLTYYMNRIQSFLISPKTCQVFPGLSKDVEDILIKLAGQDDLKLQGFDDDFKALVSVIKSEIERKKGEYRLICDFQESCGTRSLIYTKKMIPVSFKQPQPLRKPNSMRETNKQLSPALSSNLINQAFKLRCLNATLKFVKDESRLSLRYPDMATEQTQYVLNMFEHNDSDGDAGLGYKTLYAPLWEAMKTFGLKYKFTLRYTDPTDKAMKCLILDKIPILQASKNKENQDQNAQKLITQPQDMEQNTSKISLMDISDENIVENSSPIHENTIKIDPDQNNDIFKKPTNLNSALKLNISDEKIQEKSTPIHENTIKIDPDKNNDIFKKPTNLNSALKLNISDEKIEEKSSPIHEYIKIDADKNNDIFKKPTLNSVPKLNISDENIEKKISLIHENIKMDPDKNNDIFKKPNKWNGVPKLNITDKNIEEKITLIHEYIKIDADKNNDIFKKPTLNSVPKLTDAIRLLGDNFMKEIFKRIQDFIIDKSAASMICYNMSPLESQVLIRWNKIMKKDKYKLVLSSDCLLVLSRLSHSYEKTDFSIQISEGRKKSKTDSRRDVTLNKVPFGDKSPVAQNHVGLTSLSSSVSNKSPGRKASRSKARRDASAKRDSSAKRNASATRSSARRDASVKRNASASRKSARRDASAKRDQSAKRNASAARSSARRDSSAKRDQSARPASATSSSLRQASAATNPSKANKIKMKLLEGLDQPVNSDKAIRMMLNMGWEGGALGTRGEGIVEPIRPSLDTGKRYGLGAPIEEPKPMKTLPASLPMPSRNRVKKIDPPSITRQYHYESLKLILNLLSSTSNTKEISFPESNINKEWNYVKNVVILFNKGIQISGGKRRLEIIDQILDAMFETDWILTAGLKTDRLTIVIKKSILPLFPDELKLYCEIAALHESKIYNDGTFKDIYKGLRRNATKHVKKPSPKYIKNNTEDIVKKESSSTELNTRSSSKDQKKEKVKPLDDIPNSIGKKDSNSSKDLKKTTELTDDFKNNVLANMLLFCQKKIDNKMIKFENNLNENQIAYIMECIEKANMNTSFLERTLETRFYEQIIAAMDGVKIGLVFSSPCTINLEKLYPTYDLSVKNRNNNVTIHYYDEDIDTDGETNYL